METIAEFMPAILSGAGLGAMRGAPAAGAALRELPGTMVKHAIAPGIVVQGPEDAYPESQAGALLQKAYPAVRHALPTALAMKRYLGSRRRRNPSRLAANGVLPRSHCVRSSASAALSGAERGSLKSDGEIPEMGGARSHVPIALAAKWYLGNRIAGKRQFRFPY